MDDRQLTERGSKGANRSQHVFPPREVDAEHAGLVGEHRQGLCRAEKVGERLPPPSFVRQCRHDGAGGIGDQHLTTGQDGPAGQIVFQGFVDVELGVCRNGRVEALRRQRRDELHVADRIRQGTIPSVSTLYESADGQRRHEDCDHQGH